MSQLVTVPPIASDNGDSTRVGMAVLRADLPFSRKSRRTGSVMEILEARSELIRRATVEIPVTTSATAPSKSAATTFIEQNAALKLTAAAYGNG